MTIADHSARAKHPYHMHDAIYAQPDALRLLGRATRGDSPSARRHRRCLRTRRGRLRRDPYAASGLAGGAGRPSGTV